MKKRLADLTEALRERLAVIRDEKSRHDETKHIARLREVSEKIDRLQESLPPSVDPRLRHFLERGQIDFRQTGIWSGREQPQIVGDADDLQRQVAQR